MSPEVKKLQVTLSLFFLATACTGGDPKDNRVDADGDGWPVEEDCDDNDPAVNPSAPELCNQLDDNCDGVIDDETSLDAPAWHPDLDGDGFGNAYDPLYSCTEPTDVPLSDDPSDCDDTDPEVRPGATEVCDGVDNDCDHGTPEAGLVTLNGENHPSIQEAIWESDWLTGSSEIFVCEGTYLGTLDVYADLTLTGVAGPEATILDGQEERATVTVDYDITLQGFTITGGDSYTGGGIDGFSYGSGHLTVENCIIEGNTAQFGGGIAGGEDQDLTLVDVVVRDNTASASGGGIYMWGGQMRRAEVYGNTGTFGGGIYVERGRLAGDAYSHVYDNDAEYGGGIYLTEAELAGGIPVDDNTADYGGGVAGRGTVLFEGAEVRNNTAQRGGGAYLWYDAEATFDGCVFEGNTAKHKGGGVFIREDRLESVNSSWGVGENDNDPDDVAIRDGSVYGDYGEATSFSCAYGTGVCN